MPSPTLSASPSVLTWIAALSLIFTSCQKTDEFAAEARWQAPSLPSTPAGQQAAGFFAALDSGETATRTYVGAHFNGLDPGTGKPTDRRDAQARLARESGGIEVYEVVRDEPYALGVIARYRLTRAWREMTVFTEDKPPYLVSGIMIIPVDPPASLRERARAEGKDDLDPYVQRLTEADAFSGVLAVTARGEEVFAKAYGLADREAGRANTLETRFDYASVGKMFTGVAIAQLVEAGKLEYEDSVGELMPAVAKTSAAGLTVDQLLTHRTGLADIFDDLERFGAVAKTAKRHSDFFPLFIDAPLRTGAQEQFAYSNSGYILLGAIIESISGQPYESYLREHVFGPAGMTHTTLEPASLESDSVAHGYTAMDERGRLLQGPRQRTHLFDGLSGTAAGGGTTTARDMLRFAEALRRHQLLSPEATELVLRPHLPADRPGSSYGYGFYIWETPAGKTVGHSGGAHGVDAQFALTPADGRAIVILANYEGVAAPVLEYFEQHQ